MKRLVAALGLVVALALVNAEPVASGEWTASHDLSLPPNAPPLSAIDPPDHVFWAGPVDPEHADEWRTNFHAWLAERRAALQLDDALSHQASFAWTRRAFTQVQALTWDRALYDRATHRFTVDAFLDEETRRFGPIDVVLLWSGYPNLGVDERNQFDLMRDLPGGLPALRDAVARFHRRGVHVFLPFLAWDNGTRREPGGDIATMVALQTAIDADGVNFDGLNGVPPRFATAAERAHHPLVLEPQFETVDGSLARSAISWNEWAAWEHIPYPLVPMVSLAKELAPAHMTNVTDRYARDKTDSLQHAFFNGEGYAVLEDLWGFWAGFSERDAETVLRTTRIERALADILASPSWEPHVETQQAGVYASRFPSAGATAWLLVNRREVAVDGEQLAVPDRSGARYVDLWHGTPLVPDVRNGIAHLTFPIDALGFGAVIQITDDTLDLRELTAFMAERSQHPLRGYDPAWHPLVQTMADRAPAAAATAPPGMVRVAGGAYDFVVRGNEIESGYDPGVDVQFPWEKIARREHRRRLTVPAFFIDRTPVTNAQFARFLAATRYRPGDSHNFLRDWSDGTYPAGWGDKPVTWVSPEDASAYASWAGKRLPHDWEWQRAAQGDDGRRYPWGPAWDPSRVPRPTSGPRRPPLPDVGAFPSGASPYGVLDLVGTVGQWTDVFTDAHTRAALVRGGSAYVPYGSAWYFPPTNHLDEHEKLLLVDEASDRFGTVGFRCVADAR